MADTVNLCVECRAPVGPDERLCVACNQAVSFPENGKPAAEEAEPVKEQA